MEASASSRPKEQTNRRNQHRRDLVIVGIIVAIVWSLWLGIIIALIGLIAFGGFVRGRWF